MTGAAYVPREALQRARTLAWVTRQPITAEALAERDESEVVVARGQLDEAVGLGFLKKESVLVGYPALYVTTAAGRQLAGTHEQDGEYVYCTGLGASVVTIKDARHTIACAGVTAALERRYPDHRVIGERELRRDERELGRRLASAEIRGAGKRRSHSPDIVIWPPAVGGEVEVPLPISVEVELTLKSKEKLTENVRGWACCRHVEAVIYYAETRKIEEKLLDVIEKCKAEDAIVVNPLSEILSPMPGFALIDE